MRHRQERVIAIRADLIRKCRRRGRSLEDAEDLVQEAYLRFLAYRRIKTVYDEIAFLFRVVSNLNITLYHREQVLTFAPESIEELEEQGALVDDRPDFESMLIHEQRLQNLSEKLSSVSRKTCRIFLDHRLGYTYDELSAHYGLSERTVKKHISRAILLLMNDKD